MKKLILLVLVAAAAWQAWKHYPDLLSHKPRHEAIVENDTGDSMTRVRLSVGGQTFVREELAAGDKAVFPFRVSQDATFQLAWESKGGTAEMQWRGGTVTAGPIVARHRLTIQGDGGVIYRAEPMTPGAR